MNHQKGNKACFFFCFEQKKARKRRKMKFSDKKMINFCIHFKVFLQQVQKKQLCWQEKSDSQLLDKSKTAKKFLAKAYLPTHIFYPANIFIFKFFLPLCSFVYFSLGLHHICSEKSYENIIPKKTMSSPILIDR